MVWKCGILQDFRGEIPHVCWTRSTPVFGPKQQSAGYHSPWSLHSFKPVPAGTQLEPGTLQPLIGDGLGHFSPPELLGEPAGPWPVRQQPRLSAPSCLLSPEQPAEAPALQQLPGGSPELYLFWPGAPGGAGPDAQRPQDAPRWGPARAGLPAKSGSPAGGEPVYMYLWDRVVCHLAQWVTGASQRCWELVVCLPCQPEERVRTVCGLSDSRVLPEGLESRTGLADLIRVLGNCPGLHWPHLPFCTLPEQEGHKEAYIRHAGCLQGGVGWLPLPLWGRLRPPVISGLYKCWTVRRPSQLTFAWSAVVCKNNGTDVSVNINSPSSFRLAFWGMLFVWTESFIWYILLFVKKTKKQTESA